MAGYGASQADILSQASPLVAARGRLVYVTCSVLPEENEDQISAFLAAHRDFRALPIDRVWRETIGPEPPATGDGLQLTPYSHGTDGFFISVLERLN